MYNAAFQARRLNCVYLAVSVPPARLAAALEALPALDLLGANVTVPYKERVVSFLDETTPDSRLIGAVNTIVHRDGRLVGHNTDGSGFLRAVREAGRDPRGEAAVILGAGGAARAVAVTLALHGVKELVIFNRTVERGAGLAALIRKQGVAAAAYGWDELAAAGARARSAFARACLIVQTTSLGMHPRTAEAPPVPPEWISANHLVYDLVYNPAETAFLQAARLAGARTANGLGMLLYQGVVAFELWTGQEAPVETMRAALRACLEDN
jgi:shikimate dehydrogenase